MPDDRRKAMHPLRRLLIAAATVLVVAVVVLDVLAIVGWPESGPLAIAGVFAAHLTIVALVVGIPVAFLREALGLRLAVAALVVLTFLRFGGEWLSIPDGTSATTPRVGVATWNLEVGGRSPRESVQFLRSITADVVALQELTPEVSAAIAADLGLASRYPYQTLYPRSDVLGLGLLSRYPLADVVDEADPSRLSAMADTPIGRLRIANVHPLHDEIASFAGVIPIDYRVADRDASLATIREEFVGPATPTPTILLGDINTAPTEPAFGWFAAGLRDAHAEVGTGPGWTYRPDVLELLGIGLIRIDVVLTGPGLRPVAEATVCPTLGDHCAVTASVVADPSR